MKRTALLVAPEAPFPVVGGGPMRTASVLHYLLREYDEVHVITWREPGAPDPREQFPAGIAVDVIALPVHSKSTFARAARNLGRAARGIPPLIDRFRGFDKQLASMLRPEYDVAVVEHFWAAHYAPTLRSRVRRLVWNLHNIESTLMARCAESEPPLFRPLFRRWARCCQSLEVRTLPLYDLLLTTSETDAGLLPGPLQSRAAVIPNAIPAVPRPVPTARRPHELVFSGNMEYHPNLTAVRWFLAEIWPNLRDAHPAATVRFLGKNEHAIASLLAGDPRLHATGPLPEAVPALAESAAAIVPLVSGSGTRFKILEAWAAELPVVSTTVGAEGLPGRPGEHLLIADTPSDFAGAVVKVLQNPALACRLADNGRRLYERELTWDTAWKALSQAGL